MSENKDEVPIIVRHIFGRRVQYVTHFKMIRALDQRAR